MTNLSSDEFAAKLDVYENEASWRNQTSDKTTFMLENVTSIHPARSKTHKNAFEIIERHPVLVLSGCSDLESYGWMLTLQQILTPGQIEVKKECYQVTVSNNEHSKKWSVSGDMIMSVTPTCISLVDKKNVCIVSWGFSTLKKFDVQKESITGMMNILVIECGPNSPTGQSCFQFVSDEAQDILKAIRQSICLALEQKQNARKAATPRQRAISVTVSEKSFQHLLENNPVFSDSRDRSGSDSSSSTTCTNTGTSPTYMFSSAMLKQEIINNNNSFRQRSVESSSGAARPVSDLEALMEREETSHGSIFGNELNSNQGEKKDNGQRRHNSDPNKFIKDSGYSVIRDVELPAKVRRNTFSAESFENSDDNIMVKQENVNTNCSLLDDIDSRFDSSTQLSKSDRYARYKEQHHGSPFTTMTFPRTSIDTSTLSHGPRTDVPNGALPTSSPADSTRKRSNSTGDIQCYKHRTKESKSENDYEELDELRASVQKIIRSKKTDSPPELPARPNSKSFSSQQNLDLSGSLKKKRFTFKRPLSQNKKDSSPKAMNSNSNMCTCGDYRSKGLQFMPGIGPCTVCGGATTNPNPARSIVKSMSNEELTGSTHSSVSDLYMSISDVSNALTKRRRSSDITPVSSFLSLPDGMTNPFNKTGRPLTSSQDQAEPSFTYLPDPFKGHITAPKEIGGTVESSTGDPLLLFETSSPPQPPSQVSPSNLDLLTSYDLAGFPESPPPQTTSPSSGHFVYPPTQNHRQVLVPETRFSGNFWGEAPPSFPGPSSYSYHNNGSHTGQASPLTAHYATMRYNYVGNGFIHGNTPDITEQLEALTIHDDNVYVKPSGLHDGKKLDN